MTCYFTCSQTQVEATENRRTSKIQQTLMDITKMLVSNESDLYVLGLYFGFTSGDVEQKLTNSPRSVELAAFKLICRWWEKSGMREDHKFPVVANLAQQMSKSDMEAAIREKLVKVQNETGVALPPKNMTARKKQTAIKPASNPPEESERGLEQNPAEGTVEYERQNTVSKQESVELPDAAAQTEFKVDTDADFQGEAQVNQDAPRPKNEPAAIDTKMELEVNYEDMTDSSTPLPAAGTFVGDVNHSQADEAQIGFIPVSTEPAEQFQQTEKKPWSSSNENSGLKTGLSLYEKPDKPPELVTEYNNNVKPTHATLHRENPTNREMHTFDVASCTRFKNTSRAVGTTSKNTISSSTPTVNGQQEHATSPSSNPENRSVDADRSANIDDIPGSSEHFATAAAERDTSDKNGQSEVAEAFVAPEEACGLELPCDSPPGDQQPQSDGDSGHVSCQEDV